MLNRQLAAFWLCVSLSIGIALNAQQTESFRSSDVQYFKGLDLFHHSQYEAARKHFGAYVGDQIDQTSEFVVNAKYYHALSTMRLFHKDASFLMETFVRENPESTWAIPAKLDLGLYHFNRRKFDEALYWFNQIDLRDLEADRRTEVQFKKGFSAFELNEFEEAERAFYELKDTPGEYYGPTNYYYGHIAYTKGNYQTALEALNKAATDESFAPVVPYYVAQIYHFQERYDELIDYAVPLVDSTSTKRKEEIAHLVGNAYYQKQEYTQSVPYLELYMTKEYNPSPEDAYQMGYAYYRDEKYKPAIDYFVKASTGQNALGQISTYQMADAYVKMGEKKFAQNAFKAASQLDYDREVTEDALFNYAKLAYELSYDPFHEAIQAFDRYLSTYPNSNRKDEAYAFLLKVHLATKNYKAALTALDQMKSKGLEERTNYQLAAYNYAVQEMRKSGNEEALKYFKMSKTYPEDPKLTALADYWIGDLYYRTGEYGKAVSAYRTFLASSSAFATDYYNTANYNIGYCQFKLGDYGSSLTAFRSYTSAAKVDLKRKNDALLRIGDLHLVRKEYDKAIASYSEAIELNKIKGDYALFQVAIAYGYQENYQKKIETLQRLFQKYPETSLAAAGYFELGDSQFLLNSLNPALSSFNTVIDTYAQSPYRKKALLKRGLVQYRLGQYQDAIASYKTVVSDYGVDAESKEAIAVLKNIYLDLGQVDEFSSWLNSVPNYSVSPSEIDSLTYQSAENLIADGKCAEAINAFENYLKKYPSGLFVVNANYYLADCAFRQNNFDLALSGFEKVIAQPVSQYTEAALLGAATIRFDRKEYEAASRHYQQLAQVASFATNVLEAQIGQMRCDFQLGLYDEAMTAADQVVANENSPESITVEARLIRGKINMIRKSYDAAKLDFAWLATNAKTKEGAEGKYRMAEIAFIQGNLDESEKNIFELVQGFASFDFWKIKGFLLLADVYTAKKDYFQAKATLKSVIDNVKDQALVDEAKKKLADIEAAEARDLDEKKANTDAANPEDPDEYENLMDDNNSPNK
jgi:tetratricopeptide (TPR) repeat protein